LLIRPRKGVNAEQRWQDLVDSCDLFESIRNSKFDIDAGIDDDGSISTNLLAKVVPLNGDITEPELGLSPESSKLVCDNVSVVFHCAATVRFDERMRLAVQMNVEGTQRLLRLCDKMKRLDAFVHASTAYCNCDRSRVDESVYPAPFPWRRLVEGVEWMSDDMFDRLTPFLIGDRPNTYTFTKAVTESMIVDDEEANQHLPIVIVRPSIVTAIWRDPIPGWIDNVNGATGLIALGAKGLLRSLCGDLRRVRADLVPVDIVASTLIVAAWHRGSAKGAPMPVIHCTTGVLNPVLWGRVVDSTISYFKDDMPLADMYRIPGGTVTMNRTEHRLRMFFDHLLPAYMIDLGYKLIGRRPFLVRTYGKIYKVLSTLEYFYTHEWDFDSGGIVSLNDRLSEEDRRSFCIDVKEIDWASYMQDYHAGVRKYIFKEQPSTVSAARRVHRRRRLMVNLAQLSCFLLFFIFMIRYLI